MFVIASLGVLAAVYWTSAAIAHVAFWSPQERALPAPARAGAGLLLSLAVFSAAWQFLAPAQAWLLGLALLAVHALAVARRGAMSWSSWRTAGREHARGFAACVAIALVFFGPLAIKQRFGPFSEGGGDVSIYADSAQFLGARQLTARTDPAGTLDQVLANFGDVLATTVDRAALSGAAIERYERADRSRINPPAADNAVYRSLTLRSMSPFLYVPYVEFHFLSGDTNYAVYYGIQALVYALLVACGWSALRRYGRLPAAAFAGLLLASHALVSVPYNTYSAQTFALFACVLLICLLLNGIRPWTLPGLRTSVVPLLFIWVSYAYYFSILGPLYALALFAAPAPAKPEPSRAGAAGWVAGGVLVVLMLLLVYGGSEHSLMFLRDLTVGRLSGGANVYMGEHVPAFSFRWNAFLFGFISQQHLLPFASELDWLNNTMKFGIACGAVAAAAGAFVALRHALAARRAVPARFPSEVAVLAVLLATAAAHLFVAQAYIYTQAKGAQNVLPVLYAAMVMPLALLAGGTPDRALRIAGRVLVAALLLFAVSLAVPRAVSAYKIARNLDRATILEPSYYSEASRVLEADPRAFVLFEPRKSADLYVSTEPFFGARMIPTRHLVLTRLRFETRPPEPQRFDGSYFIAPGDVPHLWKLGSTRFAGRDTWHAERVAGNDVGLHLFADDYFQDQGDRARSSRAGDVGRFSWLRSGSTVLYLPAGRTYAVEVVLSARDPAALAAMKAGIARLAAAGELPPARVSERDAALALEYDFPSDAQPRLARIAKSAGEYWVNVRVNGAELPKSPFAPKETAVLTASVDAPAAGPRKVRVSWTGVLDPDRQDWIGVFPEGGGDETRVVFRFTGATESGRLELELPPAASGSYDVRFFRAGTWNTVAATRIRVEPR